jgi:alkylation response protein AidB-like acyl-CoA dehydrogenase
VILCQELGRSIGGATVGSCIQADIATHILIAGGSDAQKRKWSPKILAGEVLQCMPLTEPNAGSDVTAIRTTAIREGGDYVINGRRPTLQTAARPI